MPLKCSQLTTRRKEFKEGGREHFKTVKLPLTLAMRHVTTRSLVYVKTELFGEGWERARKRFNLNYLSIHTENSVLVQLFKAMHIML